MRKQGVVIGKENQIVRVAVMRQGGCGGECSSCHGCGDMKPEILELENNIHSEVGDIVNVVAKGQSVVKYTLVLYSIPLMMMILGIVIGYQYFQGKAVDYELYSFLLGIGFLGISLIILRGVDRKFQRKKDFLSLEKIDTKE
ncbi:MAG: SoxR reducing system RseC family protein [Tissierellia bacterium]|nr:SoxR reducing system RseC family protein [Tissierellia bacterium]